MSRSNRRRKIAITLLLVAIVGMGLFVAVMWTGSKHGVFMARHGTLDRELLPQLLLYLDDAASEPAAILLENERYVFLISDYSRWKEGRVGVWHDKETGSFSYLVLQDFSNPVIPTRPPAIPP